MIQKKKTRQLHKIRNVKLVLEYDGTEYSGWQSQINGVTIQSKLEKCFTKMLGKRVPVIASGRTDAGVHALAQVAHVKGAFPIDDGKLLLALNSFLPHDIGVRSVETVPETFHAIRDAKSKTYRYVIHNCHVPSPLSNRTSTHIRPKLNLKAIREAAKHLVGSHDFKAFQASGTSIKKTVRKISSLDIKRRGEMIVIEITSNGFLKYMVRNIVGTLIEVGKGRMQSADMQKILKSKDRKTAGPTAPARGLTLVKVVY